MFIVNSYPLAVALCIITMLCWGSWGNTQKLAGKTWRYELFYWDYVIGILIFSIIMGFTLGSFGEHGRDFISDLGQLTMAAGISAFIGGVIFNGSNILLSASVSISGLSVAFPLGVGLALVFGVFINYFAVPKGNPYLLFGGVALVAIALICNGMAAAMNGGAKNPKGKKGIWLAIIAGVLMSLFYSFVAAAMDLDNFENPEHGKATPYTAFFIFALGIFTSNILFNTYLMKKPIDGVALRYSEYFSGSIKNHCVGLLGGVVWAIGTLMSYIAAGKAGAAISYALGQGAPMMAALWGVFIWKEFKGSGRTVNMLLTLMFILFISGLSLVIISGGN